MDIFEDIEIKPKLAPIHIRVFAALIDSFILLVLSILIAYFLGEVNLKDKSLILNLSEETSLILFLFSYMYLSVSEEFWGQTIGKRILQIKVVKNDYSKILFGDGLIRHLVDIVDCILLIGLIVAIVSPINQRIGDKLAKTIVVET